MKRRHHYEYKNGPYEVKNQLVNCSINSKSIQNGCLFKTDHESLHFNVYNSPKIIKIPKNVEKNSFEIKNLKPLAYINCCHLKHLDSSC